MAPMRVLISGAGVAGPTLAWFLAKTGAQITLVEKSPSLLPHGQNVDICGSAITLVNRMGLMNEFKKYHTREKGTQFIDPAGKPFGQLPVLEGEFASFTSEYEILRSDLALILYEATKGFPNVSYKFGTTITDVVENTEEKVKVALSNGEVQDYDLLVAADGQWSKVRKQCFPPESIKVVDKRMYSVYWTIPRLPTDNDWWNIYVALKSRIVTLRPDPHGTIRAMITRMPLNDTQKQAWQAASRGGKEMQRTLLREEFADAGWQMDRLLGEIEKAPDFYFQAIQQIRMDKWSTGRVVCLGDTAYAPTPLTGMGTSLAIDGAFVLAGELSKLEEGEHPAKALEAYDAVFRPFVEKMQHIPSIAPGFAHPVTAWGRWFLQMGFQITAYIATTRWIMKLLPTGTPDQIDFPLPSYPRLEQ